MPTFLVFKSGKVSDTIRGANPSALRTAVARAAADASAGASSAFESTKGYRLGSAGEPAVPIRNHRSPGAAGVDAALAGVAGMGGLLGTLVRFVALYLTTLFSFDAAVAAEASPFNVKRKQRSAELKNR
jgi:thioredoxin 1